MVKKGKKISEEDRKVLEQFRNKYTDDVILDVLEIPKLPESTLTRIIEAKDRLMKTCVKFKEENDAYEQLHLRGVKKKIPHPECKHRCARCPIKQRLDSLDKTENKILNIFRKKKKKKNRYNSIFF